MEKFLIIDSSAVLTRVFLSKSEFKTQSFMDLGSNKVETSAIVDYLKYVEYIIEKNPQVKRENIVHVLDSPNGSDYRKSIYPEYKMNRPEKDPAYTQQRNLLGVFLLSLGCKFLQVKGVEADDVIGTLSLNLLLESQNNFVSIFSGDKDMFQLLLNERIELQNISKHKNEGYLFSRYTHNYVEKNFVDPSIFPEYLALCGDTADNIKGVKNIGKVKARQLLNYFSSSKELFEKANDENYEFPKGLSSARKYLVGKEVKDTFDLSLKLTTINRRLPLPNFNHIPQDFNNEEVKNMIRSHLSNYLELNL